MLQNLSICSFMGMLFVSCLRKLFDMDVIKISHIVSSNLFFSFVFSIYVFSPPGTDFCVFYEIGEPVLFFSHIYNLISASFIKQSILSPCILPCSPCHTYSLHICVDLFLGCPFSSTDLLVYHMPVPYFLNYCSFLSLNLPLKFYEKHSDWNCFESINQFGETKTFSLSNNMV